MTLSDAARLQLPNRGDRRIERAPCRRRQDTGSCPRREASTGASCPFDTHHRGAAAIDPRHVATAIVVVSGGWSMSISIRVTVVASAAVLMLSGCDEVRDACVGLDDEVTAREVQANGTFINGTLINGTFINGTLINGTLINGTFINGTDLTALDGSGDYTRALTLTLQQGNTSAQSVWL